MSLAPSLDRPVVRLLHQRITRAWSGSVFGIEQKIRDRFKICLVLCIFSQYVNKWNNFLKA